MKDYYTQKYIFILFSFCCLFAEVLFCEGFYLPENSNFIKTGYTIKNLCWNPSNTTFAYTEGNLVLIRDANSFQLLKSIEIPNIEKIMFSKEGTTGNELLLTLTKDGILSTYNLELSNTPTISLNYKDLENSESLNPKSISALSFSQNSNYIVLADTENVITLLFKLRFTNETISYKNLEHEDFIYNIVFSPNTWYFATASKDNTIKLYSTDITTNLKSISTIPFYSITNASICFTQDSKNIICATKDKEFSVVNLKGAIQYSIKTTNSILGITTLQNSSKVAIQTDENQIEIYDLETKEYLGFIPSYNSSLLTTFAFSDDNKCVLLGYADGSIYKFDIDKVFLQPNQSTPDVQIVSSLDVVIQGGNAYGSGQATVGGSGNGFGTGSGDGFLDPNAIRVFKQSNDSIIPKVGLGFLSSPFLINLNITGEYRNVTLISPVYFGGSLKFSCGFPRKDFPYTYLVNGIQQKNPYIFGVNIYGNIGIIISPWIQDLFLILGCKFGTNLSSLGYFPQNGYLITKPILAFATGIQLGASFKGFELDVSINYDATNKFYPEILFGYQIELKKKDKTSE